MSEIGEHDQESVVEEDGKIQASQTVIHENENSFMQPVPRSKTEVPEEATEKTEGPAEPIPPTAHEMSMNEAMPYIAAEFAVDWIWF